MTDDREHDDALVLSPRGMVHSFLHSGYALPWTRCGNPCWEPEGGGFIAGWKPVEHGLPRCRICFPAQREDSPAGLP